MAKSANIGSKRLISLNPVAWVRWLTGDNQVDLADLLSGEFQWISRANTRILCDFCFTIGNGTTHYQVGYGYLT